MKLDELLQQISEVLNIDNLDEILTKRLRCTLDVLCEGRRLET